MHPDCIKNRLPVPAHLRRIGFPLGSLHACRPLARPALAPSDPRTHADIARRLTCSRRPHS